MNKTWKSAERKIAELLGGKRVPVTGRQRGDAPDIEHPFFSVEVKHWQTLPNWLHEAMEQAEKSVRGNKIPIAVLHETGTKYDKALTVVRLGDMIKLYQKLEEFREAKMNEELSLPPSFYE